MRFCLKFLYSLIITATICGLSTTAFDLDETVDDDIRKNYNSGKISSDYGIRESEDLLPDLPSIIKNESMGKNRTQETSKPLNKPYEPVYYSQGTKKIKKGTVFNVVSSSAISDWQKKGTNVKFVTKKQINTKNCTIPAWTVFKGEIIESHQPQITCNGGLVVIHIYSMTFNNKTVPVSAYVIKANDKKIFFNDIKGERTYLKTMWKKGNWGRSLFDRMLNLTVRLGADGATLVLSPFPFVYGTLCLGLNTLTSPVTAFFSKGGHVNIPSGSYFRIKLTEDAYAD